MKALPKERPIRLQPNSGRSKRGPQTEVRIGAGEPDVALLSSVIREWIVPALVREFLAEHPTGGSKAEVNSANELREPHSEEAAG